MSAVHANNQLCSFAMAEGSCVLLPLSKMLMGRVTRRLLFHFPLQMWRALPTERSALRQMGVIAYLSSALKALVQQVEYFQLTSH